MPTPSLSSTVYAPNPPSEKHKVQKESADSSSAHFDMNYGNPTITPLPVFPSVNPSTMSYQAGPEPGISSTVDSQIYPRKEPKGKEGSAESLPADLDMNCGKVPVCLSIHHVCIIRGPCLVSPRQQMPPTSLRNSYRAARVYRFIDFRP